MQNTLQKIGCLGPQGSYSQLAAMKFCDNCEILLFGSFPAVVSALISGEIDFAVLPIENSIQGGVLQNLDLLDGQEIFAVKECVLPIDHRLVTRGHVPYERIKCVYSHEQAIGQCSEFLERNLPAVRRVFTQSTAECLEKIGADSAGIVGGHVRGEGLVLSDENIANEKNNFTRFMLCVKRTDILPQHSDMVFFCAVCAHKPGALAELLRVFEKHGLNLTRIESRPIPQSFGEYRFFIEFAGDIGSVTVSKAILEAESLCMRFRILGAY